MKKVGIKFAVNVLVCTTIIASLGLSGCGGASSTPGTQGTGENNPPTAPPSNPPAPQSHTITATFAGQQPAAVAERIGSGTWATTTLQNGQLLLTLPAGTDTYGIAYRCPTAPTGASTTLDGELIAEGTLADGESITLVCTFTPPPTAQVSGSVDTSVIPIQTLESVYTGGADIPVIGSTETFSGLLPAGTIDVAVLATSAMGGSLTAIKLLRSQVLPGLLNGGLPIVFSTSDEIQTSNSYTLPVAPTGFTASGSSSYVVNYVTPNHTTLQLSHFNAPSHSYGVIPAADSISGDVYLFSSQVYSGTQTLFTSHASPSSAPIALTYPTVPSPVITPAAASFPTLDASYTGFAGTPGSEYFAVLDWQANSTSSVLVAISATAAYQNGATTITFPDLTALPGFLPSAKSGTQVGWGYGAKGGSYLPDFQLLPTTGGSYSYVASSGSYIEP